MQALHLITIGKLKGNFHYLQPGIDDYIKRLKPWLPVSIIEIPDEPITATRSREQVLAKETARLLSYVNKAPYVVSLSENGEQYGSERFSAEWFRRINGTNPPNGGISTPGSGPMIVIVGGPLGLSEEILQRSDWVISLSAMTFPHPLVRLVFLEQLYRAYKIHRNEPYHK
ncbi:MAG: 23S rRNA (pseudouridine(1915)-N(3))-methyltransferase RlmH [Vampirovibrio sp.]|nr:23S rRNA (pseudouridine(1915)-N(3))-methyltransferase RlmH [Vampirovibrio sp.]